MSLPTLPHSLSEKSFEWLRAFFERESGIHLRPEKKMLVISRLQKRLEARAIAGFEDYCALLQSPDEEEERAQLLDALTTHETYFFRDPRQFAHLGRVALPGFRHTPLRIWSAACSTGEEVWSLAMQLADHFGLQGWELIGSDISHHALHHAARALYPLERLDHLPGHCLKAYCRKGIADYSGKFLIGRPLRERVQFRTHNLLEEPGEFGKFDVIFLRNVLIYFDTARRRHILHKVCGQLRPGGYLYLGEAESMMDLPAYMSPAGQASVFRHLHADKKESTA